MNLELALFLGFIQWITEFLPISSSGHLALFEVFFWEKDFLEKMLSFDAILHWWSLFALLIYFWRDIFSIISWFYKKWSSEQKIFIALIIATIPAVIFWILKWDFLEKYSHSLGFLSVTFLVSSIYFFVSEWSYDKISKSDKTIKTKKSDKQDLLETNFDKISFKNALLIWISQAIAVIPWISRSWTTLSTWILLWIKREEALRFSFLMWMPIILWAMIYLYMKHWNWIFETFSIQTILAWFFSSFFFSIISIHFLIQFFKKYTLRPFAVYLLLLALWIFGYLRVV